MSEVVGPDESARRSGYVSEDSKRRFTLIAGILGAVFFVLQMAVPFVLMLALMPAMMTGSFADFSVEGAAVYQGRVHLIETTNEFGRRGPGELHRLVRVGGDGVEEVARLGEWGPDLLAGDGRLWLISPDRVGVLEDDRITPRQVTRRLGDACRPFWFRGAPAVVESRPDGSRVMRWEEAGWEEALSLPDKLSACGTQAVATAAGLFLFRQEGQTLYAMQPQATAPSWEAVSSQLGNWCASSRDGRPVVVTRRFRDGFRLLEFDGRAWTQADRAEATSDFSGEIAAFQESAGAPLLVVSEGFPGSLRIHTWDGGGFAESIRVGRGSPFPPAMGLLMTLPHVLTVLLSLALAAILAALMRNHRIGVHDHEGRTASHASLTRRAAAQIVDASLVAAPVALAWWLAFSDFEAMIGSMGPLFPLRFMALLAGVLAWTLLALVVFSFSEGHWGVTPGKWAAGIRVVGTDLAPCGFGRALVRNLLKFVDGFFNFLIGILLVAYTPDWQRLGDMAARTIVIRQPGPAGSPP